MWNRLWGMGKSVRVRSSTRRIGATLGGALVVSSVLACGGSGGGETPVEPCTVRALSVTPTSLSLEEGATATLTPSLTAVNCGTPPAIVWTSAAPIIATVDGSGHVTAGTSGVTSITISTAGLTATVGVSVIHVPMASFVIEPSSATVPLLEHLALSTKARDVRGNLLTGRPVAWKSLDPSIVTIDATGVVSGVSVGQATVTASSENFVAQAVISIVHPLAASVAVALNDSSIEQGATAQASATVRDRTGAPIVDYPVRWTSSNTAVATIDSTSGAVTATGIGSTSIVASADGIVGQATLQVTEAAVASINIQNNSAPLVVGTTRALVATLLDARGRVVSGRPITWSSDQVAIASVNASSGLVTAVSPGQATIRASAEGAVGVTTIVVQSVPVASVSLQLADSVLVVGGTTQATAVAHDAQGSALTGRAVTWSSSDPGVATVNATSGAITAVGVGTTTITATVEGKQASAVLRVTQAPVATVTVTLAAPAITTTETTQATAALRDARGNLLTARTIAWSTANMAVAVVHPTSGLVTAIAPGTTTIIATSEGRIGQATITVSPATQGGVATVSVTLNSSALAPGDRTQGVAVLRDANGNTLTGRTITWSSANVAVATVDPATGLVTAVAPGSTTISATSEGKAGQASLTVTVVPVASIVVTLASSAIDPGQTTQATAVLKDASGNVLTGRPITWTTSSSVYATVDINGLVTAVTDGQVYIRAWSGNAVGEALLVVNPQPVATVTVSLTSATLNPGESTYATVTARDAQGRSLLSRTATWSVGSPGIAVVPSSAAWSKCADDGQTCSLPSPKLVRWGIPSSSAHSYTQSGPGNLVCGLPAFPFDPAFGAPNKQCEAADIFATQTGFGSANVQTLRSGTTTVSATVDGVTGSTPLTVRSVIPMAWASISGAATVVASRTLTGGTVTVIRRTGQGSYGVIFDAAASGMVGMSFTALVVPEAGGAVASLTAPTSDCRLSNLITAQAFVGANVNCFSADGTPGDFPFRVVIIGDNVLAGTRANTQYAAFTHAPAPLPSTPPTPAQSWNSWGAPMQIMTTGTNTIRHVLGLTFPTSYVAFGSGWSSQLAAGLACEGSGSTAQSIDVSCVDRVSGPTLQAVKQDVLAFHKGRAGQAYAWATVRSNAIAQEVNPSGTTSLTRLSAGRYSVVFGGSNITGTDPAILLSPAENAGNWRRCAQRVVTRSPVTIEIACWDGALAFTDANFNVAFLN